MSDNLSVSVQSHIANIVTNVVAVKHQAALQLLYLVLLIAGYGYLLAVAIAHGAYPAEGIVDYIDCRVKIFHLAICTGLQR
jgi:hypothetical protein